MREPKSGHDDTDLEMNEEKEERGSSVDMFELLKVAVSNMTTSFQYLLTSVPALRVAKPRSSAAFLPS